MTQTWDLSTPTWLVLSPVRWPVASQKMSKRLALPLVRLSFLTLRDPPLPSTGLRRITVCYCRSNFCSSPEVYSGTCTLNGIRYFLCCQWALQTEIQNGRRFPWKTWKHLHFLPCTFSCFCLQNKLQALNSVFGFFFPLMIWLMGVVHVHGEFCPEWSTLG